MLLLLIVVCVKKKRICFSVVISTIITLIIIAVVGIIIFDYVCGEETAVTSINIDDKNSSLKGRLFMTFDDEQENMYWGLGSISRVYYGDNIPVRITYLPKTKFVLGVERYVGDVPQIPLTGIDNAKKDYIQIYSNGDSWSLACIFILIMIIICSMKN